MPSTGKQSVLALLLLVFALVPAGLAVVTYHDARRKDERLFEASTQVLAEQLRRRIEIYDYFFGVTRTQTRTLDSAALSEGRMIPASFTWKKKLPHLIAIGYAESSDGRIVLRWKSEAQAPAPELGTELTSDPRIAAMMKPEGTVTFVSTAECLVDHHRLLSVRSVLGNEPSHNTRGFIVAWIDLKSFCDDTALSLVRDQVLTATPLNQDEPAPTGATRLALREGSPSWAVGIARGVRFSEQYGPPTPWPAFIAIGLSTAPLLVLVTMAGRALRLSAALDAEREVVRQQRYFTQGVSHEFRTPLTIILTGAELLENYADKLTPERKAEVLNEIKDCTRRMTEMVEQVLLLGRIDSGKLTSKLKPVNIATLCHDLARKISAVTLSRNPITVTAPSICSMLDTSLVDSILENLLSNAVKYSRPGQPVTLDATIGRGRVKFTVRDDGIGIPAGDIPCACDPFHRGDNVGAIPGTGLGLAIAQRCATLHDGTLNIESEEGRGCVTTLSLPHVLPT